MSHSLRLNGDCKHAKPREWCELCLRQEVTDLRDAIRLIIGRDLGFAWHEVPQTEVDVYLDSIRTLKGNQRPATDPDPKGA